MIYSHILYNYDLYAIYKGTHRQHKKSRYRFYLKPELKVDLGSIDEWLYRLRSLFLFCYLLMLARFSTICFVQLANYHATTYDRRQFLAYHSSQDLSETIRIRRVSDTRLSAFIKRFNLDENLSNYLSDFPGISLGTYIVLFASITYVIVYMPYYYSTKPMDCVYLRIGIDFHRERTRIDLVIKEQMESLLMAIETNRIFNSSRMIQRQQKLPLCESAACTYRQRLRLQPFRTMTRNVPRKHPIAFEFHPSLRPASYTVEYYKRIWHLVTISGLTVVPGLVLFASTILFYSFSWTTQIKCHLNGTNPCKFASARTKLEIYSLFELACVVFWFGLMLVTSTLSTIVSLIAQLDSIDEMKSDLNDLLSALRLISLAHRKSDDGTHSMSSDLDKKILRAVMTKEPYLQDALLQILVKTRVNLNEFMTQAEFLSNEVSSFLFYFGSSIVVIIVVSKMDGPHIAFMQTTIFIFLWICSNLMLIACAHMYSEICKLQRIGWSIMAQLSEKLALEICSTSEISNAIIAQLAMNWERTVRDDRFADVRNSVRPFGVSLTYKQMLQLNFYITSLAALVLRE